MDHPLLGDLDAVLARSTAPGPSFMFMNFIDNDGDESKHWEIVPRARSYLIGVRRFPMLNSFLFLMTGRCSVRFDVLP